MFNVQLYDKIVDGLRAVKPPIENIYW